MAVVQADGKATTNAEISWHDTETLKLEKENDILKCRCSLYSTALACSYCELKMNCKYRHITNSNTQYQERGKAMIDISMIPFWAWWFLGLAIGGWAVYLLCTKRKDGVIHVMLDEEKDKYLFEFHIPPEEVPTMKQVIFAVKIEQKQDSQKIQSL